MQKQHAKVAGYVIVGALLIGGVYMLLKYFKGKGKNKNDGSGDSIGGEPVAVSSKTAASPSGTSFPIAVGSKGTAVKQLQLLLGVTADGSFGPKTEAALKAKTGKTSIANQAEYNSVINQLRSEPEIVASKQRADMLINSWKQDQLRQLSAIENVTAYGVVKDFSNVIRPNGKSITLKANVKLSRADYVPVLSTLAGNLYFTITRGDLQGDYTVDPNKITLL